VNRIVQLEQMLKDRERRLEDLTQEHKNLNKVVRDQEKVLGNYQNEEENQNKLKASAEELKSMRSKIRELQEKHRAEERNFKKQQEYITVLENKYKEVCAKVGVQPNLDNHPQNQAGSNSKQSFVSPRLSAKNVSERKSPHRLIEDDEDFEGMEVKYFIYS
jgi:chromosome segregation ATPase